MSICIDIVDQQVVRTLSDFEVNRIKQVVEIVIRDHDYEQAELSIAILDNAAIQQFNKQYLNHDWPTDVISFLLSDKDSDLEAQLLISCETADCVALELPWNGDVELLLYAIHGTLHLLGYDDATPEELAIMRAAERKYLLSVGVEAAAQHPHFDERAKFSDIEKSSE